MFSYIKGKLSSKSPTVALVDIGGVGFEVRISLATYSSLPDEGKECFLHTYLAFHQDRFEIFGFSTVVEKEAFLKLITVPGLGAKTAISILSGITPVELYSAIQSGDISALKRAPGIGEKKAKRILAELHGTMEFVEKPEDALSKEAISALVSLGYSTQKAIRAVSKVRKEKPELTLEETIKKALVEIV